MKKKQLADNGNVNSLKESNILREEEYMCSKS